MALEKGTTLGGYEITGILGQGGMGVVYEATQVSLSRTVALKVLAPHLSEDVLFRERFRREGQIQAGIDHQHIVPVYEAGETEHGFFIAMRLIRGPNLKDLIISRVLDPGRTLRILSPIADALDTAHEAGLIHRDIKPQNILVGGRDQAFLADFGLTKASGENSLTRTGQFVGTFDYISPEQIKGGRATRKSDVYALTAVLYESLTGVVPYPKDSEAAVLYAQMTDPPPKVTDQRPELPATLDHVIATGMAKDPADRYESPGQLMIETNRSFTRRMRAVLTPPRPIEAPQETGVRSAEEDVSTRESSAQDFEPPTERGALEADTLLPADPGLTVRSGEPAPPADPAEEVPPKREPAETVASAPPPPETVPLEAAPPDTAPAAMPPETMLGGQPSTGAPAETGPGTEPPDLDRGEPAPPETREGEPPAETAVTAPLPGVDVTQPGRSAPGRTRLGQAGNGAPTAETRAIAGGAAGADAGPAEQARRAETRRARPARRADAGPMLAAAGLLLLVVVVIGFLIGRSGGDSEEATPAAENSRSAGGLELNFPDGWRRSTSPPDIPGLEFRDQIPLTQNGSPPVNALMAGFTNATGPALLPDAFVARLSEEPPRNDAVKLGDLDVYRYRGVRPRGFDGRLTMYVAPTSSGVATIACTARAADAGSFLPSCERVAGGLKLIGAVKAFALGGDPNYTAKLKATIRRLNVARRRDLRRLGKAKKRAGQAAAATALANDYRRAVQRLGGLSVSPAVVDASKAVRSGLARTEEAYRRLAAAARRGRGGAYSTALRDIGAGDRAVDRALRQVERAG